MKKPNFKSILKKITIIDALIIICIIGAVVFAFMYTGGNEDKTESISFDSSSMNKFAEKYLSFYQDGQIVKTHIGGYNATSGEYQELYGTVVWVDDDYGANVQILIDVDGDQSGKPILARLYKDEKPADIYTEHITLETSGAKYKNVTEIEVAPKNISTLSELAREIGNETNYTVTTKIATDEKDSKTYQDLYNKMFLNGRKESVTSVSENIYDQIKIIMASPNEINMASNIFGTINGETGLITIRIYNSTPEDIKTIENNFNVLNIRKVT
ncbi:hypothetical protein MARBORIA2_00330 [Methanobrevibacter arboriphilus]|jgi:hypothetical protein|uniref:Uncharacterized protein n=2 Tax=Methanobrevibacter arboriphilus TaxID=39441 RepID=A0ACA8R3H6_METAZ|nr:adhesin [Methanobrevibacter arboriphilus]MCC7561219.1 adhesin [Methanobrevibacter arboriphilus]BBL61831.1 hypothetical protein MarbSA_08710 [Methanobrevibacter arboriphilus]GLI10943.1 hypothetical protein MARBORIA2_00330 [Methanobrevibacter arboriphilus]